jgi:hypothetical protein
MTDTPDLNTQNTEENTVSEVSSAPEVCEVKVDPKISIDQFKDIQIKIGKILSVEISS